MTLEAQLRLMDQTNRQLKLDASLRKSKSAGASETKEMSTEPERQEAQKETDPASAIGVPDLRPVLQKVKSSKRPPRRYSAQAKSSAKQAKRNGRAGKKAAKKSARAPEKPLEQECLGIRAKSDGGEQRSDDPDLLSSEEDYPPGSAPSSSSCTSSDEQEWRPRIIVEARDVLNVMSRTGRTRAEAEQLLIKCGRYTREQRV